MVFVAVVLTLLICVLVDKFLRCDTDTDTAVAVADTAPAVARCSALEPVIKVGAFRLQREFSYHPGHAWVWPECAGIARLGSDDFTSRLLGRIDAIDLPSLGTVLRQGEYAWSLHRAARCVPVLAPLSGRVVAVNERLRLAPDLARCDPYGEGWLLVVVPHRLRGDLSSLLHGDLARYWLEGCAAQVRAYACRSGHLSMPSGGETFDDLGELLGDAEWAALVRDALRTELD